MLRQYYAAYGSNLNIDQMLNRCPNFLIVGTAILDGYRLIYKGTENNSGFLTIERYDGYNVPLGIYMLSTKDISNLDRYEGYPIFYDKEYIPIEIKNEKYTALIYIMNNQYKYTLPSKSYINTCMKGYDDFGFDKKVLNKAFDDTIYIINNK